jgi:hypothetical protein
VAVVEAGDAGAVADAVPPVPAGADGLLSLLETSVALRSSSAEGFLGPLPSGAGFPVFLVELLSFLLM